MKTKGRVMKVEELKNYGRPLSDVYLDPETEKIGKKVMKVIQRELRRELGTMGTVKLLLEVRSEIKLLKKRDWSRLKEHGPVDDRFIESILQQAAAMKVLGKMMGMDRATGFYHRLIDRVQYDASAPILPSVEDFKACGDAFAAFKQYAKGMIDADQRVGIHEIDIIEDTPKAFAYNVKYCIWNEVAKEVGVSQLCYAVRCYGDEVLFNSVLPKAGITYKRTATLTLGRSVCDPRFELAN